DFTSVKHVKPASSRKDSSERYVLALGFRGIAGEKRMGQSEE
ncbi:MAG: rRNA methyltransferase, partial [Tardiphaga sp.]|nr:rRNA methyltransferase [Tardiphaga sp.]